MFLFKLLKYHSFTAPAKVNTQASEKPQRRPSSQPDSVFVSDEEDDDDIIVVKSTWRTRHLKPPPKTKIKSAALDNEAESLAAGLVSSPFFLPGHQTATSLSTPKHTFSAPTTKDDSPSSDEEFTSLLERLKNKNKFRGTTFSPQSTQGSCYVWIFTIEQLLKLLFLCSNCYVVFPSRRQEGHPCVRKAI